MHQDIVKSLGSEVGFGEIKADQFNIHIFSSRLPMRKMNGDFLN